MKKILVCQHVPYEILGTLNPLFKSSGFRIRYVNFGRYPHACPDVEGYHGLVLLGGPMNVDEIKQYPHLKTEMGLVENALKHDIPVLGICLGAQLVARALGSVVKKNREKEIGWYDVALTDSGVKDAVLRHFGPAEKIFQWHGDAFDIPHGAEHLAQSSSCVHQAFRYGKNVYGFQFHLEVDEVLIERWLRVPRHKRELEELRGRIDPERIRQETPIFIARLKKLSTLTFGEFVKLLGGKKKKIRLSSI